MYIGLTDDLTIVASEPYGLVEVTDHYIRMDGETPAHPDQPLSNGQVVTLTAVTAGQLDGIMRLAYDGTPLPVRPEEVVQAEVTTRDIDRGDAPHFLLKEIREAPQSFAKALRGHIVEQDGRLRGVGRPGPPRRRPVAAGGRHHPAGPASVRGRPPSRRSPSPRCWPGSPGQLDVDPITATELSGFHLRQRMDDTLVIAVSQSGTTTDTNRTVDLARACAGGRHRHRQPPSERPHRQGRRCAVHIGRAGRRDERRLHEGLLLAGGRGALLACAITEAAGCGTDQQRHTLLAGLPSCPQRCAACSRPTRHCGGARRLAPSRRYWAVVGNGPNTVAAEEIRIKLSEPATSRSPATSRGQKHIDLSSEPLILVCAAGLVGSTADDVAKEVAIFRFHKAAPVVIATEGEERFRAARR